MYAKDGLVFDQKKGFGRDEKGNSGCSVSNIFSWVSVKISFIVLRLVSIWALKILMFLNLFNFELIIWSIVK